MPSPRDGLLSRPDWDEDSSDLSSDYSPATKEFSNTKPYWKPAISMRKYRRAAGRIRSLFWSRSRTSSVSTERLRPTAYLDGLRGFAAFLVYWHHHQLWAHGMNNVFENGTGFDGHRQFVTLPVVRHFFTGGHYAVSTFFVISGYVLASKPLSLMAAGEYVQLGDNIASALFRRWFRLFLPLIAVCLVFLTTYHALGMWVRNQEQQGTWREEVWNFYLVFKNFSFVFKEGGQPWIDYQFHSWSIPVEMRGSVVIYTALMALSRATRNARLLCEVGLIYYFMYISDGAYFAMFVAGMLLCDLDLLAKKDDLPRIFSLLEPFKDLIYYHLLVFSLLLGGIPSENREVEQLARNRGWYYLSYLKPQAVFDYKWFYLFWAAVWLVAALPRIPWLKRFFETDFCQYLGRISYGLYLVHGPVLWTIGDRVYAAVGFHIEQHKETIPHWIDKLPLPKTGPLGLEVAFLLPNFLLLLPLTLFLANAVTRFFDTPSVKFASWLYKKTLGGSSQSRQTKA